MNKFNDQEQKRGPEYLETLKLNDAKAADAVNLAFYVLEGAQGQYLLNETYIIKGKEPYGSNKTANTELGWRDVFSIYINNATHLATFSCITARMDKSPVSEDFANKTLTRLNELRTAKDTFRINAIRSIQAHFTTL